MDKKDKIVDHLVRGGYNEQKARRMVDKYIDLATRRGCETIKEYAEAISWFSAV